MTARLIPGLTALLLLVAAAALGSVLADRLAGEVDISPIIMTAADKTRDGDVSSPLPKWRGHDPAELTAIVDAPLFIEGRRMPDDLANPEPEVVEAAPPQVEEAPPVEVEEPDLQLVGVLIAPGASKALIADNATGRERWISEAEKLGDWIVETIADDHLVLRHQDENRRIDMRR
ncbi:hypothetical protein [Breoghania sp. JC706]|uniref:hypothetical protein n=1 Tax=Breoghania sp. JC706 TaxID=3117732 RepID=UPI00300BBE4D